MFSEFWGNRLGVGIRIHMKNSGALHVLRIIKRPNGTLVELGFPFAVILIVLIAAIF